MCTVFKLLSIDYPFSVTCIHTPLKVPCWSTNMRGTQHLQWMTHQCCQNTTCILYIFCYSSTETLLPCCFHIKGTCLFSKLLSCGASTFWSCIHDVTCKTTIAFNQEYRNCINSKGLAVFALYFSQPLPKCNSDLEESLAYLVVLIFRHVWIVNLSFEVNNYLVKSFRIVQVFMISKHIHLDPINLHNFFLIETRHVQMPLLVQMEVE